MQPQFVDLHTHSTASDGTDSPAELVRKAAAMGLAAVALTDHDTLSGLDEAEEEGRRRGIEVVRGCELGVATEYGEMHLLGLWLPHKAEELEEALKKLRRGRATRNERILRKLGEIGYPLELADVLRHAGGEAVGRPHIAAALIGKGYAHDWDDAFNRFIGAQGLAYVPRDVLDPESGVALMSGLGAAVCIAHPMLLRCPREWFDTIIPRLKTRGLTAVEAWHSEHSAKDERFCVDLAARHGLGLSGGSDYHGAIKPKVRLGRGKGRLRVSLAAFEALKARHFAQRR